MLEPESNPNPEVDFGLHIPLHGKDPEMDSASLPRLEEAILKTVAYVDIFNYPLTAPEIHRYLIGVPSIESDTDRALYSLSQNSNFLECRDGYYSLVRRGSIVETRKYRKEIAQIMWPKAEYYGNIMAALPFVLMVSVTGSLAVDNADLESDIDYLIVTSNNRLWTTRAMIVLIVRLAAKRGTAICPNYLVTEEAMTFQERNLYSAREVAQMELVAGFDVYQKMRDENKWVTEFLPNASGPPKMHLIESNAVYNRFHRLSKFAEILFRTPPGGWVEKWEMNRKIRKLSRLGMGDETAFSSIWCKGHFDNHGRHTLDEFDDRWRAIDGYDPVDEVE
jgi:predicted nucleotidyltransferase